MDEVILVDDADTEIGRMEKMEAHRGEGRLHRAISVFLFNEEGKLLIQQRSEKKIVGALQWANTCCGNVRPGETYHDCAVRRLKEELGIEGVVLHKITTFRYQVKCTEEFSENEIDTVFVGRYGGQVIPNKNEVNRFKWISWRKFKENINLDTNEFTFAPWVKIMANDGVFEQIGEEYGREYKT